MTMIQPIQGGASNAGMPKPAALTAEQTNQVASILSEYDADSLTTEDAEAIREAFREAEIRPSRDLRQAIEAAGFDAEAIGGSQGGPERGQGGGPPPPPQGQSLSSLESLKEILSQYDLSNLDDEAQDSLLTQLQESGLVQSGLYVNITS